jgi:hypothetical protein
MMTAMNDALMRLAWAERHCWVVWGSDGYVYVPGVAAGEVGPASFWAVYPPPDAGWLTEERALEVVAELQGRGQIARAEHVQRTRHDFTLGRTVYEPGAPR